MTFSVAFKDFGHWAGTGGFLVAAIFLVKEAWRDPVLRYGHFSG